MGPRSFTTQPLLDYPIGGIPCPETVDMLKALPVDMASDHLCGDKCWLAAYCVESKLSGNDTHVGECRPDTR